MFLLFKAIGGSLVLAVLFGFTAQLIGQLSGLQFTFDQGAFAGAVVGVLLVFFVSSKDSTEPEADTPQEPVAEI
ncbi:MAG: hypothetical protein ACWA5L_04940 [bacterium]